MAEHRTPDPTPEPENRPRPTRYWTDGTEVTLDVEEALDRIVETVRRIQNRLQAP